MRPPTCPLARAIPDRTSLKPRFRASESPVRPPILSRTPLKPETSASYVSPFARVSFYLDSDREGKPVFLQDIINFVVITQWRRASSRNAVAKIYLFCEFADVYLFVHCAVTICLYIYEFECLRVNLFRHSASRNFSSQIFVRTTSLRRPDCSHIRSILENKFSFI